MRQNGQSRFNPSEAALRKKVNDYLLAANPRAEFVCNFPQEIYRGTSLPAAVPSSVSPLSRARGTSARRVARAPAPAILFPFFPPIHPRLHPRRLTHLSREAKERR